MPEDLMRRQLREHQQKVYSSPQRKQGDTDGSGEVGEPPTMSAQHWSKDELPDLLERNMLELWMLDPTAIYAFWEHVLPEHLRSPITRMIYNQCCELIDQQEKPATFDNLMTAFDDPWMKNYLIELDASARKKFFDDEEDDIDAALREELTERWKEPEFRELKEKLVEEILAAFARQELDRKRREDLNQLRSADLSDDEKTLQLLELQQKLRKG
jgi:hypothetical protein